MKNQAERFVGRQRSRRLVAGLAAAAIVLAALFPPATVAGPPDDAGPDDAGSSQAETRSVERLQTNSGSQRIDRPRPEEEARETYLGRRLAEPMSHLGAGWLVRPEREREENASRAIKQLQLQPGMVVCDMGCGNGYWTLPMARLVGPKGKVYAVDIQPEMLHHLKARAARTPLRNIELILGDVDDPKFPPAVEFDLVLMVDVYHEFSHPESMLWAIRNSLAATGVAALLEFREEDPKVPIKPLHKMSKDQIMKEYQANGFKLVREYNELPWQHLMFFARDDSPLEEIEPEPYRPR